MLKIITFFVTLQRRIRSYIATAILRMRAMKCGVNVRAARIPHISSTACVLIGDNAHFNGITITGLGEANIGNYFHSGTNVKLMLGSHDYDHDDRIPYGNNYLKKTFLLMTMYGWVAMLLLVGMFISAKEPLSLSDLLS